MRGVAAVSILLHGDEVLLMKRVERDDDPWSGDISFPGGRMKNGDLDLLDTALRELYEEAGVWLERGDVVPITIGVFNPISFPDYKVYAILIPVMDKPDSRPGPEAEEIFWLQLSDLKISRCMKRLRGVDIYSEVECVETGYGDIWGLTLRIIKRVLRDFI